jgi:hypothetical protein
MMISKKSLIHKVAALVLLLVCLVLGHAAMAAVVAPVGLVESGMGASGIESFIQHIGSITITDPNVHRFLVYLNYLLSLLPNMVAVCAAAVLAPRFGFTRDCID